MKIGGLQKLTLLDVPGRVAATVFLRGCNFRCPFCHNAGLLDAAADGADIPEDEVFFFLEKRRGLLDAVCVSGGEPLMHDDALAFLHRIKEMGYFVKLDTNGCYPDRLEKAVRLGLADQVAMDVKHTSDGYCRAAGLDRLDMASIGRSIDFLLSGPCDYEFRTTVVKPLHGPWDLVSIARRLKGARHYFLQQFVPSGNLAASGLSAYGDEEMRHMLSLVRQEIPSAQLRGVS